jgi:hypothetical protein
VNTQFRRTCLLNGLYEGLLLSDSRGRSS